MDRARHIAVAFQVTQLARQHAVRDVSDESLYFVEPFRAGLKHGKDQKAPFVPDLIEHVPEWAVFRALIAFHRYFEHSRTPILSSNICDDPMPGSMNPTHSRPRRRAIAMISS